MPARQGFSTRPEKRLLVCEDVRTERNTYSGKDQIELRFSVQTNRPCEVSIILGGTGARHVFGFVKVPSEMSLAPWMAPQRPAASCVSWVAAFEPTGKEETWEQMPWRLNRTNPRRPAWELKDRGIVRVKDGKQETLVNDITQEDRSIIDLVNSLMPEIFHIVCQQDQIVAKVEAQQKEATQFVDAI